MPPARIFSLPLLVLLAADGTAENITAAGFGWIDPAGIHGTVIVFSQPRLPPAVAESVANWTGDADPPAIVVVPHEGETEFLRIDQRELPGTILARGPLNTMQRDRLTGALANRPDCVALVLDDGATLVVQGRRMEVVGDGAATVLLAACAGRPLKEIELKAGSRHDFVMLRRAAQERSLASFPPRVPPTPRVESGALVIAGGGALPGDVMQRFIELAGGPEAPLVVMPIAAEDTLPEDSSRDSRTLTRAGARNVTSLRARKRDEVESAEFLAALASAKGVWFNGGRQWRFVDAYMGTKADALLHGVLRRGGVIGGSSAGASIQGQYMPRGSPLGNTEMMADGYERGLGFLPGVAIDQHFSQRRRHADMTSLMRRYPQLLGIGIDEATALVVQGSQAQVLGRGNIHFYDYRAGPPGGEQDYTLASPGQRFDLADRRLLTAE